MRNFKVVDKLNREFDLPFVDQLICANLNVVHYPDRFLHNWDIRIGEVMAQENYQSFDQLKAYWCENCDDCEAGEDCEYYLKIIKPVCVQLSAMGLKIQSNGRSV